MGRVLRTLAVVAAVFGLTLASAPSAVAADPVITFTVSGASSPTVDFCPWTGSTYNCDGNLAAYPTNNVQFAQLRSSLAAGEKYAVRVTRSGYWTLWWHQGGISTVKPSTAASGEFVSAGASSLALGTFSMKQKWSLSGLVTTITSVPIDGIQIGIYANLAAVAAGTPLTDPFITGEGTDSGAFNVAIPYGAPGSYVIGMKDPLGVYAEKTESVTLAAAATTLNFSLALEDGTVTVGGTVALVGGGSPSGVSVDAFAWTGTTWEPATSADSGSDGSFQMSIVKGRTFTLRFTKTGYQTTWLGGAAPGEPTDSNSRVANSLVSIDLVTLAQWASAFGKVAGQNLAICTQHTLNSTGTYTAEQFDLGFSTSFYGKSGSRLFVTDKGFAYLSDTAVPALADLVTVPNLATWAGAPILAPLWFDGDLSGAVADSVTYGSDGSKACIRWNDLGHYSADDSAPNTFQLIIESKATAAGRSAGDFDLTFNYDQVLWDSSGTARIGYTAGDKVKGHYWVNPDADGATNTIIDSGNSPLVANSQGSSTPGRYVFEIHNALVNTVAPAISGETTPGKTLTATAGTWLPTPSGYSYQWYRSGTAISGATGATYVVPSGDLGAQLTVTVTAARTGLSSVSAASRSVTVLRAFTKKPKPTISGTVKVGSTLTAKPGTWSPTAKLRYQWYRGSTAIAKATSSKYKVVIGDVGQALSVRVNGTRTGYLSVTSASSVTKVVPKVAMKAATPKITGTAKVGKTLKVSRGSWTSAVTFQYQWYRSGAVISGAVGSSYQLTSLDKGKTMKVKVTGIKTGYVTTSKTSKATKKIT